MHMREHSDASALRLAARASPDGKTVVLVFGTIDFLALLQNWACHALALGIRWFVLVAMDGATHARLSAAPSKLRIHALLLPRVRNGNVNLTKFNVIGERQVFGLSVLEQGFNVLHSDADALWIKDPFPLLSNGDVVAERIWGKPLSVVKEWGAAICTGFYFLRSTPPVLALARAVRTEVARKRRRQPRWQASDQFYINHVLSTYGVRWAGGQRMAGAQSMVTRYFDINASVGVASTPRGPLRLVMLAHGVVPRACPMLSEAELQSVQTAQGRRRGGGNPKLRGKAMYWNMLLESASVLHCFPPEPKRPKEEKRVIFMGHPAHTSSEVAFARRQGLWRVASEVTGRCRAP